MKVHDLLADYQARQIDPDTTDEDMLFLRAYLDDLQLNRPEAQLIRVSLVRALEALQALLPSLMPDELVTVESIIAMLDRGREVTAPVGELSRVMGKVDQYTKDIETRHARLIALSNLRSETRLKNTTARQLDVFTLMTRRFMGVLHERLSPDEYAALMKHMEADLSEVPEGVLEPSSTVKV